MKQIIWFVKTYATFVVLFVLQKPLFLFLEKGSATQPVDNIFTELPAVIWHGLPLDLSMAGYLSDSRFSFHCRGMAEKRPG